MVETSPLLLFLLSSLLFSLFSFLCCFFFNTANFLFVRYSTKTSSPQPSTWSVYLNRITIVSPSPPSSSSSSSSSSSTQSIFLLFQYPTKTSSPQPSTRSAYLDSITIESDVMTDTDSPKKKKADRAYENMIRYAPPVMPGWANLELGIGRCMKSRDALGGLGVFTSVVPPYP